MRPNPTILTAALFAGLLGCAAGKGSQPAPETRTTICLVHVSAGELLPVLEKRKPDKVTVLRGVGNPDGTDANRTSDREIIVIGAAEDVATVVALAATLDVSPPPAPDPDADARSLRERLEGMRQVAESEPPVRLVYALPGEPVDAAQRRDGPPISDQVIDATMQTLQERIGTDGRVVRADKAGLAVELRDGSAERIAHARRRIEAPGRLELRILAEERYRDREGRLVFDLDREKLRLEAWLDRGNRAAVQEHPGAIERYNDDADLGPLALGMLRWYPHLVRPRASRPAVWDFALSASAAAGWVACYAPADFNLGTVPRHIASLPAAQQKLLEFVAVNVDEKHWTDADLDRASVKFDVGVAGTPCLQYRMRGEQASAYADWSAKHRNKRLCVLLDGVVLVTPFIPGRSTGDGSIADDYTPADMEDLAAILRTRPLAVAPRLVRQEAVTAAGDR